MLSLSFFDIFRVLRDFIPNGILKHLIWDQIVVTYFLRLFVLVKACILHEALKILLIFINEVERLLVDSETFRRLI